MAADEKHEHQEKDVTVFINGHEMTIPAGTYTVPNLKKALGVAPDDELAEIKGKETIPLKDSDEVKVHNHEKFISHKRRGGSA